MVTLRPHVIVCILQKNASRYCTEEASWFLHPKINKSWTNYTACPHGHEIHLIQTTPDWEYNVTHGNQTIIAVSCALHDVKCT